MKDTTKITVNMTQRLSKPYQEAGTQIPAVEVLLEMTNGQLVLLESIFLITQHFYQELVPVILQTLIIQLILEVILTRSHCYKVQC